MDGKVEIVKMEMVDKETFNRMNRDQMWELFNALQKDRCVLNEIKADTSATLQKITVLENRVVKLESEVSLLKNANNLLLKDKSRIERKVLQDNQYHRL